MSLFRSYVSKIVLAVIITSGLALAIPVHAEKGVVDTVKKVVKTTLRAGFIAARLSTGASYIALAAHTSFAEDKNKIFIAQGDSFNELPVLIGSSIVLSAVLISLLNSYSNVLQNKEAVEREATTLGEKALKVQYTAFLGLSMLLPICVVADRVGENQDFGVRDFVNFFTAIATLGQAIYLIYNIPGKAKMVSGQEQKQMQPVTDATYRSANATA